jgi:hypothetical protein
MSPACLLPGAHPVFGGAGALVATSSRLPQRGLGGLLEAAQARRGKDPVQYIRTERSGRHGFRLRFRFAVKPACFPQSRPGCEELQVTSRGRTIARIAPERDPAEEARQWLLDLRDRVSLGDVIHGIPDVEWSGDADHL